MEWLIVLVVALVVEIATCSLVSIWFCGGALLAILAKALNAPLLVQIIIFLISSILLIILTKPFINKHLIKNVSKTNIDAIIGKLGVVTIPIDNLKGEGQVKIEGQLWTARSLDDAPIDKDSIVEVEKIEGVKVIVSLKDTSN